MQGFPTAGFSTGDEIHGDAFPETGLQNLDDGCKTSPVESSPARHDADPLDASTRAEPEDSDAILFNDDQNEQLLKSFDMIFRLHQRSEEIRSHLEHIDCILLNSRSVEALADNIITALETEFGLAVVRFLFKEDHPVASVFRRNASGGAGIISEDFLDNEGLFRSEPFVLDDPAGNLAHRLFGDSASLIASAAIAPLCHGDVELGLLCLGSDDPCRYCGGINTDLIASMAAKISLGILNAWDHQNSIRRALTTRIEGVYTEPFFHEYVEKEFNRAWRNRTTFSLLALSWKPTYQDVSTCPDDEVIELLLGELRSSDLAAKGEAVKLWLLLPDTNSFGAEIFAKRLTDASMQHFNGEFSLHIGITEFCRSATVCSTLVQCARSALDEALGHDFDQMVIKTVSPAMSSAAETAEHDPQSATNAP